MSRLTDSITWSGSEAALSLFIVFPAKAASDLMHPGDVAAPTRVLSYDLGESAHHLRGRVCREYDLVYDDAPRGLEAIVRSWFGAAFAAGADFAWFGFEGSFDFAHILTADVADQIFAVGSREGVYLALEDDYREGPDWASVLSALRDRFVV